uniref:Uncharacterized protein n=1 Tax=Pristionchus pacificus TaxID=54126 RepID=A0A2A6CIJ8_PRIPA|eukprot:PDM77920.1 hypothetical protein PRIPAC_34787 [Pristionchus pacificus]
MISGRSEKREIVGKPKIKDHRSKKDQRSSAVSRDPGKSYKFEGFIKIKDQTCNPRPEYNQ